MPVIVFLVMSMAWSASAQDREMYRARAVKHDANGEYANALEDFNRLLKLGPGSAGDYNRRGSVHFKLGRIDESIADFDKAIQLDPAQEPHHWQRGISYYYAGRFDEGRRQFELHRTVNPQDVENAVWHYLCQARLGKPEEALKALIPIRHDSRIPMMQIYALFQGKGSIEEVMRAAQGSNTRQDSLFYAHLYIGLYHEAHGNAQEAGKHIRLADGMNAGHYMWNVANVHARRLK